MTKVRRTARTAKRKLEIVEFAEKTSNSKAAKEFGCHESSVRLWRKNKNVLKKMNPNKEALRYRKCFFPEIEKHLKKWILKQREEGLAITPLRIRMEAKKEAIKLQKYQTFKGKIKKCISSKQF